MDRVSGAFKRWSQIALVVIALLLTIATNSSATRVAATLWNQPAVRDAAVQAAKNVSSDKNAATPKGIQGTADAVKSLQSSRASGRMEALGLRSRPGWHDLRLVPHRAVGDARCAILVRTADQARFAPVVRTPTGASDQRSGLRHENGGRRGRSG